MQHREAIIGTFQKEVADIFGDNLSFAFICGGFARGYASTGHDVDMVVVTHNPLSADVRSRFHRFYVALHESFHLVPDLTDPGELLTMNQLSDALRFGEAMPLTPVLTSYREFEVVVWVDMLAGAKVAETGDLDALAATASRSTLLFSKWRQVILGTLVSKPMLALDGETIRSLNTTRLFRRFVAYLKRGPQHLSSPVKALHVCILGGGGNVADAMVRHLHRLGHRVSLVRLDPPVCVTGVPERPQRATEAMRKLRLLGADGVALPPSAVGGSSGDVRWMTLKALQGGSQPMADPIDVFVLGFPSYVMEPLAAMVGTALAGKPVINLSDRFMGSYALCHGIAAAHGVDALPSLVVGFNGVPTMAIRGARDAPSTIYFEKPRHSASWWPQTRSGRSAAYNLLMDVLAIAPERVAAYPSFMHLAMENVHSIEHAVVDLCNLQRGLYKDGRGGDGQQSGGRTQYMYEAALYTDAMIARINAVTEERDAIAKAVLGTDFGFMTIAGYDRRVFGSVGLDHLPAPGTAAFRAQHPGLGRAPAPLRASAFGYEDVLCAMVPLASLAEACGVHAPATATLIAHWSAFAGVDYRSVGRTARRLQLVGSRHDGGVPPTLLCPYRNWRLMRDWAPEPYARLVGDAAARSPGDDRKTNASHL